jgi:hypothetical protein
MSVIRVVNPAAVEVPEFQELVEAASPSAKVPSADLLKEMKGLISTETVAVLVKPFTTLAILALPEGVFMPDPQMVHFFNRGHWRDKEAVLTAAVDFLKAHGYNRALALNQSGKTDEAWAKTLTPKGWKAKHKASLYEFEGP